MGWAERVYHEHRSETSRSRRAIPWTLGRGTSFPYYKGNLEARPIFHFTEKRIEAHICICFMAYKVYKELERIIKIAKIKRSGDSVLKIAKTIVTIRVRLPKSGATKQQVMLLTPEHHVIEPLFDINTLITKS